jgi:hypothetical protein
MKLADTQNLYDLLDRLRDAKIHYHVRDDRRGAVSIDVAVPGQRWEIDVLADGSVEVEVFTSDGSIFDRSKLDELFQQHSD